MDFGRGIKKRAKIIDNKLDQLVANPYEGQVKRSHKSIKKPLLISFASCAACVGVVFAAVGIVDALNKGNSNKGNGITFDPNYKPNENPDKPKPGYKGPSPKIDLKGYVSSNFGYPEFTYFSFFANSVSAPRNMSITDTNLQPEEDEQEYTTNQPMNSYTDEDGKIHTPLPILPTYSFSDFLYFEFDSSDCSFLADRIGNGHIQALCVHTNVYDEDVLVLKKGNKFYSCLGNGTTNDADGKVLELSFTTSKYIEGWDIVKDSNQTTEFTIYFKKGKGFEGASAIEVDNNSFDIDATSVYFLDYSFEISVNRVRAFIGLDADPTFDITESTSTTMPQELFFYDKTTFTLVEHGYNTFDFDGVNDRGEPIYKFGNDKFALEGYYMQNSYFIFDVNNDGYRDFVYCGKDNVGFYYVIAYDVHNKAFIKEVFEPRPYNVSLAIKNGTLLACLDGPTSSACDYADIIWNKDNTITLEWRNIHNVSSISLVKITDKNGNEVGYFNENPNYKLINNREYLFYFDIQTENGNELEDPNSIGFAGINPTTSQLYYLDYVEKDEYYVFSTGANANIEYHFEVCFQISCIKSPTYSFGISG